MSRKRSLWDDDGDGDDDNEDDCLEVPVRPLKRQLPFQNCCTGFLNLTGKEILSKLEPLIRKAVREEVEHAIEPYVQSSRRSSSPQIESSEYRGWQLHFLNNLPATLFTGNRVEAEDGAPLKVVIVDASSKKLITYGPLSSIKIEILALNGDFEREEWTDQKFNASIVQARDGKRPLVTGDRTITLRDGIGSLSDIAFTDNSSWIRSRKFRLGARSVQSELKVREAISEAFMVKDHRGELYKKHHPPSLADEVWRLEKIAKDGASHKRLSSNNIETVKDFLQSYYTNESSLRHMLGGATATKIWDTIIGHAKACPINDGKFYVHNEGSQGVGLIFNSVYKVVGAIFNGTLRSSDKLNSDEEYTVSTLKQHAYKHLNDLVQIDDPFLSSLTLGPRLPEFPDATLGQPEALLGFNPSSSSYQVEDRNQVLALTPGNNFVMEDYFSEPYSGGNIWAASGLPGQVALTNNLAVNDISQAQASTWSPLPATWGPGNSPFLASSNGSEIGIISSLPGFGVHFLRSRSGTPKARWCKIRAAVMCMISVRRNVAARRRQGFGFW
ncbi:calmodulin-binding protein 60 B-like [Malania oleifera]|uniref:calmodulin-binding protein 60 B-like n=1 Tax=Malania oleifera TaxID=397392 RepID=UPI0025ADFFC8|nr:calmodulin-binding protein 60 B-like [Malania oleifera]